MSIVRITHLFVCFDCVLLHNLASNATLTEETIMSHLFIDDEMDRWSDLNNPNNDFDLDDWADCHNPNNDSYIGDDD